MAKLTHCRECDAEISRTAEVCPRCGHRFKMHPVAKVIIIIVVAVIVYRIGAEVINDILESNRRAIGG